VSALLRLQRTTTKALATLDRLGPEAFVFAAVRRKSTSSVASDPSDLRG